MDTAFLRRFTRFDLVPNAEHARAILGAAGPVAELPPTNPSPSEIIEALVRAWTHVNGQIEIGLSPDLRIGHGVMLSVSNAPENQADAIRIALDSWSKIAGHAREVFFGDVVGLSLAFRAEPGSAGYSLQEVAYGQDQRQHLREPVLDYTSIYSILRQVGG